MRPHKIKLGLYFVILISILVSCTQKKVLVTSGIERNIYPDMVGVNGNIAHFDHPWDNDTLVNAINNLGVANFRYPAGSLGNYWDWDTGWLDKNVPDSLMMKWVVEQGFTESSNRYTLENFAKGQKKLGFTPVFMLNMLSKGLDHSVRNLLRAKDLGLPIKYIELGNELFFNLPFEMYVFPTPEDYGKTCKIWIDSLKHHFPEAKYAIIGNYIKRKERHIDWTQRALRYCTNADAVTYHKYSPAGIDGKQERVKITAGTEGISDALTATRKRSFEDLKARQKWEIDLLKNDSAYANFLNSAIIAAKNYSNINAPDGMEIWATEFNMRDDNSAIRGTWANTLYIAKYYEIFLNSPVTITNIHNVTGNLFGQFFSDSTQLDYIKWKEVKSKPWQLTAAGLSTHLFAKASKGMTKATQLNFSEVNTITDDRGNVVETIGGWLFENENSKRILLINYGKNEIRLDISNYDEFETITNYFSDADQYITNGFSDIKEEEQKFKKSLILPPFCISMIE
jgi:hypothetical protein